MGDDSGRDVRDEDGGRKKEGAGRTRWEDGSGWDVDHNNGGARTTGWGTPLTALAGVSALTRRSTIMAGGDGARSSLSIIDDGKS